MSLNELLTNSKKPWSNLFVNSINSDTVISPSLANDFVVSAESKQYPTIQSAINAAALLGTAQVIVIKPGTYNENITLANNVSVIGASSSLSLASFPVKINGTITANFTGSCSIQNVSVNNIDNNIFISTSGTPFMSISNTSLSVTGTTGSCVFTNNVNCFMLFNGCNFVQTSSTGYFINSSNSNQIVLFNSLVGAVGLSGNILVDNGFVIAVQSVLNAPVLINNSSTFLTIYSFHTLGDIPAFTMTGTGTVLCIQASIFSDASGGTDFITGVGTFIRSLVTLAGRSTIDPGITVMALTTIV